MNKLMNLMPLLLINNSKKLICTSSINFLDQRWRKKMKLPKNPNAEGPLTNLPDYTYMDGRVTPLGQRQKRKMLFQRELAGKIVSGIQEIDFAVERHAKLQKEEQERVQKIHDSKLKQKGHLLLKSNEV